MSQPRAAIVLAAGFGTRMRPLTDDRPKALLEVGGRPLVDRAIDLCEAGGVRRVVVNLHYRAAQMRAHLEGRRRPEILFSDETGAILETGGGIAHALPLLRPGAFFALNADSIWTGPSPIPALVSAWRPLEMDALLLLVPRAAALGYARPGDFRLGEDLRPVRRGADETAPLVYSGAQIVKPSAFEEAPRGAFSMNVIWDRLLAAGRLGAVVHAGGWVDVGTPEGLALAQRAVAGEAG